MKYTIGQKNNAILAFLGGLDFIKKRNFVELLILEVVAEDLTPSDLCFHDSWSWLIPAWSKARMLMTPMMIVKAITCIDEDQIEEVFELIAVVCIDWCKVNNVKLK